MIALYKRIFVIDTFCMSNMAAYSSMCLLSTGNCTAFSILNGLLTYHAGSHLKICQLFVQSLTCGQFHQCRIKSAQCTPSNYLFTASNPQWNTSLPIYHQNIIRLFKNITHGIQNSSASERIERIPNSIQNRNIIISPDYIFISLSTKIVCFSQKDVAMTFHKNYHLLSL